MNVSSEKSTSLWMRTKVLDDAPALNRGEKVDVVVVGSGIAGMSVAYELAKAGTGAILHVLYAEEEKTLARVAWRRE